MKDQIIIQGFCGKTPSNFLMDTGAELSLVSIRLVHTINMVHQIRPTATLIAGLDKKIVPMRGEIKLSINIGRTTTEHNFIVCDNIDNEFLLGINIMKSLGMCIDIPNKNIQMKNGDNVPFMPKPLSLNSRMKVRCSKTVTLPANTAMHIYGKFPMCNATHNYEGIIEPYQKLVEEKGIVVTGTMTYSKQNVVPVHCLNVLPYDVTIYKNQLIAFIEPLHKPEAVQGVYRVMSQRDYYDANIDIPRLPNADPVHITVEQGKWENPQDLIKILKIDEIDIPSDKKQQLKTLIADYSHCFSRHKHDLGCASFYEAKLHLKRDFVPKWVPSRPVSYKLRPFLEEEITKLENSGQITPCRYSLWNSAVFAVAKSDHSHRFVVDARALNSQCLQDNFELPKINNILDNIPECNWLSSFDFSSSFTQIGLEQQSRPLTAFTFNGQRKMWTRMVQGQTSSSAEFSRAMTHLFSKVPFSSLILYIDDLLVGSNDIDEHMRRIRFILDRLTFGNLKLSPRKTHLFQREVLFLGHKLSRKGLRIDENKIKSIRQLATPNNVKGVQQFLGMLNYHRKFINAFAEKAAPLYNLLRKEVQFNWTPDCQHSFETLIHAITSSPILALPDTSDPDNSFEVTVDSSKKGHGAVLTQMVNGQRRVISYFSKSVGKHLQKLGPTKLEFLGLHAALRHWRLYLQASRFVVKTDCSALLNLETIFSRDNAYFARRLADLAGYTFTIHHVSGKSEDIQIADFLSRYPFETKMANAQTQTEPCLPSQHILPKNVNRKHVMTTTCHDLSDDDTTSSRSSCPDSESESDLELDQSEKPNDFPDIKHILLQTEQDKQKPVSIQNVRDEYVNDKIISEVIEWVKSNKKPLKLNTRQCHKELAYYWKNFNLLSYKNGLLYKNNVKPTLSRSKDEKCIVLPYTLIERVMYMYHNTLENCHSGVDNSYAQCSKRFYFHNMKKEFKLYIAACTVCNKTKQTRASLKAPLHPIFYSHFGQGISIDHLEPSKKRTARKNVALLNITDIYSSYLVSIPVKSVGTEETIKHIIQEWILKYGLPECIHHDRATTFTSKLFQAILKVFNVTDKPGTSFHSQTQGAIESQNRRMNLCFRACLSDKDFNNWDLYSKYITSTLNCLQSTKTGFSANFLVYGRENKMVRDLFVEDPNDQLDKLRENANNKQLIAYDMYKKIRHITRTVRDTTRRRAMYMCNQYDKKVRGPYFETGDYCYLLVNVPKHKYSEKYTGPHLIVQKINDWNYIILYKGENKVVSISKMKHYKPNKYSKLNTTPTIDSNNTNISNRNIENKKPIPKKSNNTSDSDDDNDLIVTFLKHKLNLPATQSKLPVSQHTQPATQPKLPVSQPTQPSASSSTPVTPQPVQQPIIHTPHHSESESSAADDNEFYDATDDTVSDSEPIIKPKIRITLPDIDKHGKSKGLKLADPARTLSKSTAIDDLPSRSTTYGLRPKPKQTSFFGGSPVKGLKKTISKAKSNISKLK
jgi:transposase InsO family protein